MRKLWVVILCTVLCIGCGARDTVTDIYSYVDNGENMRERESSLMEETVEAVEEVSGTLVEDKLNKSKISVVAFNHHFGFEDVSTDSKYHEALSLLVNEINVRNINEFLEKYKNWEYLNEEEKIMLGYAVKTDIITQENFTENIASISELVGILSDINSNQFKAGGFTQ